MKAIQYTGKIVAFFSFLFFLTACEKDGDLIYLSGHEANDLVATESEVILTKEQANQIVLSLTWSKSHLSVSDPNLSAPDLESVYIQIAASGDFSGNIAETMSVDLSKAYTGAELNTIAKNLSLVPGERAPLYFRIRSSVGSNIESLYSSVVRVDVTAYEIDMTVGYVLESNLSESPYRLLSPSSNGVYSGFIGAVSWYNFWLLEGDGVIWGNVPADGSAFLLGSSEDQEAPWNGWFPGLGGCYFVEFDTNEREWSALYIPTLNVAGDLQMEMSFDRKLMQWKGVFNSTSAGDVVIRIAGEGRLYNHSTDTNDDDAIATQAAFGGSADALSFGKTATDITVNIPGTGEFTLYLDLSDPYNWTAYVQSGSEEPETVYPKLYLVGIDDGITGEWNFNHFVSLYDDENKKYVGFANVNSLWGYQIAVETDNWEDYFGLTEGEGEGEGDGGSGHLTYQSEKNIPSPDPGFYLIEISLSEMTYRLTNVGDQIWIMGMDENYQFNTPLNASGTPGVYSGTISIAADSPWGLEIQLDDSWSHKLGGSGGNLYYKGESINDEIVHVPGTYTVTVDLINMTYSITP